MRQDASECVSRDTDIGVMPHNSDPALAALEAARDRWLATRDASAVRLLLLDALRALEK